MATAITDLPASERPRESAPTRAKGPQRSRAVGLGHTARRPGESALDLAASLLGQHGSLRALSQALPEELASLNGIGNAKAAALIAALHLDGRSEPCDLPVVLRSSEDVATVARHELDGLRRERVVVLICDGANRHRRTVIVSEGSIDRALVPTREILNAVIRHDGRPFAIAHNHPSGDSRPSEADRLATHEVTTAARAVGLRFLGHVVVGAVIC